MPHRSKPTRTTRASKKPVWPTFKGTTMGFTTGWDFSEKKYILSTEQKIHGKHKDMCELGDKGSVASVTRYKRPRADSSHGASSMLFHHSPCQNLHWRNFTQAVRHLAWEPDQRKEYKRIKNPVLGKSHIFLSKWSKLASIHVNTMLSTSIDTHWIATEPSLVLEITSVLRTRDFLFLKLHCFIPVNISKLTWSHKVSFWNTHYQTVFKYLQISHIDIQFFHDPYVRLSGCVQFKMYIASSL